MDPFEIPTDLDQLTGEQLTELADNARDRARELMGISPSEITDEQLSELDRIVGTSDTPGLLDSIDTTVAAREQAVQDRQARIDAAGSRLDSAGEATNEPDGDDETDDTDEGEDTEEAPVAPASLAASGSRVARTRRSPQPRPKEPKSRERSLTLVAAGGHRDAAPGTEFRDATHMAEAFLSVTQSAFRGMPTKAGVYDSRPVAQMHRRFDDGLVDTNRDLVRPITAGAVGRQAEFADLTDLMDEAARENRLSGGSLVASGGWCAPSVTDYDMPADETLDGLIDLPEVGISRGGIRFTLGPDFSVIFGNANTTFAQTEAQAIAGTTKACAEVSCPDFQEVRLDAVGYCVKAPLLTNAAYPELVRRVIAGTNVVNQHRISARLIQAMRNLLPASALLTPARSGGTAWSALTALELAAEGLREKWRLPMSMTMEVVLPRWFLIALRADLANRSHVGSDSVADAIINQHFADRKLSPQWVLNYSDLNVTAGNPIAFPTVQGAGTGTPQIVEAMIYPAGTFVKGTASVINLDTVYDTADLQTNVYTAAFVEDGVLLAKRKYGGYRVQLPVWSSGQMGANNLTAPYGTATSSTAA